LSRAAVLLIAALAACARPAPPSPDRPRSVLLVSVDTLRADRLGGYGDAAARTPHADALARSGVLFEAAYTPAPLTLPAHATMMTGLLPPAHGVRGNGAFALGPGPTTLAEALRARGLRTGAFVGAFPVASRFGLARGFDTYDDAVTKAPGHHFEFAERPAAAVVAAATAWLAATPGPVFAWVHLFDPHAPYAPPPEHAVAGDPYRGEVAAVDAALGPLLRAWDARPEPSVVALTADHGEAFGEHGEESHGLFVYDTTLRVPLVLRAPGLPANRRVGSAVGLQDLAATLLDLAGGRGPALPGRSLRATVDGTAEPAGLYAETLAPRLDFGWSELVSWREGGAKYIRAPRPELYDLVADAAESTDLARHDPQRVARMEAALAAALAIAGERPAASRADAEAVERLRSLGYVMGPGGRGSGADPKDRRDVARLIARAAGPFPDLPAAIAAYREIAARDPANPLVNLRLADALLRAGRPRDAVPFFRKVIAGGPRTADAHVGLATCFAAQGHLADARRVLEDARRLDPGNGQVHFNLGEIARAGGAREEARKSYERALGDPVTRERARARLEGRP
jgi:arylsulfatase A-like enzyme